MIGPVTITLTGSSTTSAPVQLDYGKFGSGMVQAVISSAPTYSIEYSLDAPSSISTSASMTWFSTGLSGFTTNQIALLPYAVRLLRLNITAGTTQCGVTATIIQSQA
jgi:hypothetical protein